MNMVYIGRNSNGDVFVDRDDPDLEVLAANGYPSRMAFEQEKFNSENWDNFREYLKTSGVFAKCAVSTAIPAFLASEIRTALDKCSYESLIVYINGLGPLAGHGLKDYVTFTQEERDGVNAAAAQYFIGGDIFL